MSTPVPPAPNPEYQQVRPGQPYQYANPQNRAERFVNRLPSQSRYVNIQGPRILADRATILYAWAISMAIVGWDEWHNLHILPRPARLWDTSLFYGLLVLFSVADALVPIANAFAVGYTLTLLYQYYQGNLTPTGTPPAATQQAAPKSNKVGGGIVTNPIRPNPQPAPGA